MLKEKISDAVAKLEHLIVSIHLQGLRLGSADQLLQVEEGNKGDSSNVEQLTAAKEAISSAKTAMREIA